MTVYKWSTTASSNDDADSTINWLEGQAPSTINNSARAMMAAIAKWRDDMSGNLVTGGTSSAFTITTNQTFTALTDGISITARMSTANAASATLNVDGLGAKTIAAVYGTAIAANALRSGSIQTFTYDSTDDKWIVLNLQTNGDIPTSSVMLFYSAAAPTGWTGSDTHSDYALRVVSQTSALGGSAGGTDAFSTVFAARTITQSMLPNVTLTVSGTAASNGNHNHSIVYRVDDNSPDVGNGSGTARDATSLGTAGTTSTDGAHTHTVSGNTSSLNGNVTQNTIGFAVAYVNLIKATRG